MRHHRGVAEPTDPEHAPPPSLAEAVGGPLGVAETSLPAVAFVIAYTASGSDTNMAAAVAVFFPRRTLA